ncbi:MAG: hypothetical protein HYW47_05565 [Deltaproteobacteria bacterium]|nr:hypothetical protein [Deltaproteobacteria bacterium]
MLVFGLVKEKFKFLFGILTIVLFTFFFLRSDFLQKVSHYLKTPPRVPTSEATPQKKELFLQSSCLQPNKFLLQKIPEQRVSNLIEAIPPLQSQYIKMTSAFSFGIGVQCPQAHPISLKFKIPKEKNIHLTKNNVFLTTIRKVFSKKELEEPTYEFPLYWVKDIKEEKDYYMCEFEIFKTESKNPYFVVFNNQ